jgi:two-component system invasion response regulator UvrY
MNRSKILLVDDHAVVRAGFRYLLEGENGYEIHEVASAEEACAVYNDFRPDVVVMDMMMPGMGGLEGVRHLRAKDDDACILVLSMRDDAAYVSRALKAGAKGYLTKRSAPEELAKAVRTLMRGKLYLGEDVAQMREDSQGASDEDRVQRLSEREFEVFCLLAEGRTVVEISEDLHLSPKTVSNHRANIMQKLGAKSIVELTRLAIRNGLIDA